MFFYVFSSFLLNLAYEVTKKRQQETLGETMKKVAEGVGLNPGDSLPLQLDDTAGELTAEVGVETGLHKELA